MNPVLLLVFGYLCGSVPFGKLVATAHGVNIQRRGSGNIGFANVRRVLGWRAGLVTLGGDVLKGFLPTYLALTISGPQLAFWVGVAAIVGHVFPVWLKFRGGKGIATGLGVILAIQPIAAILGLGVYLVGVVIYRKSFIGSLSAAFAVGVLGIILTPANWWQYALLLFIACWTLRQNILGTVPNHDR